MLPDDAATLDPVETAADAAQSYADSAKATARDAMASLNDMVVSNPVPAALTAAAVGAGLMALLALMSRPERYPSTTIPVGSPRGLDIDALKSQIADLADRLTRSLPKDAAKQRIDDASDALADSWSGVRDQALDVLGKLQPQATAAVNLARENPIWTAIVMGAVGALLGSQLLGRSGDDKS